MLLLSSYNRMRYFLSDKPGDPLTASVGQESQIIPWITAVSKKIETWLNRKLEIGTYTEYFDAKYSGQKYWPKAWPISSLTSVYEDEDGLWSGNESEITDSYIGGQDNEWVSLDRAQFNTESKSIRIIYTGGLASNGTRSVFATAEADVSALQGKFIYGGSSGAYGIVQADDTNQLTVENLYGIFEAGETLTGYSDFPRTVASGGTATLSSITSQCLAESYPDIVTAAEMEIRYMWKHKNDFELVGTAKDGTNLRRQENTPGIQFTREAFNILKPYRMPRLVR